MAKTTNLYIRIEPELKEQAEAVLDQLGIPVSNAINIFLKQVVMHRGIPFDIKLPDQKPIMMSELTDEGISIELEKGYKDYADGKMRAAEESFEDLYKEYGL